MTTTTTAAISYAQVETYSQLAEHDDPTKHDGVRRITTKHDEARRITTESDEARRITTDHDGSRRITTEHDGSRRSPTDHDEARRITTESDEARRITTDHDDPTKHDDWQAMLRYVVSLCDEKDFVDLADKQILCKLVTAARNDLVHSHSTRCIEAIFQALAARGKKAYAKKILRYVSAACGWYERVAFSDKGKAVIEECQESFLVVAKDKAGYTVHFAQRDFVHGIKAIRKQAWQSLEAKRGHLGAISCLDWTFVKQEDTGMKLITASYKQAMSQLRYVKEHPEDENAVLITALAKSTLAILGKQMPDLLSENDMRVFANVANLRGEAKPIAL